jgi:hypothetical protein
MTNYKKQNRQVRVITCLEHTSEIFSLTENAISCDYDLFLL